MILVLFADLKPNLFQRSKVKSIEPAMGSIHGGSVITIHGTGFLSRVNGGQGKWSSKELIEDH